ncbi:short-chain dehydrogenase [Coniochaeta ligniaria NRRL 30616]|uniref:Short-chain dehydrogenase n=1 Tax=Coniochaeta ligniaria NRRL 30616 TaxID=1408157 RepID=A0A1J7I4L4_9PEZI|nr:short-chain dehydrogenase [Coniochaeta ligniaria NRRL 30616]
MSPFNKDSTAEEITQAFSSQIKDRIFLITGTSASGIGAYVATSLARHSPAQLILVARTKSKVDPVIQEIATINPGLKVTFVSCELTDRDSVREAADTINNDETIPHIDVIINNAGVMMLPEYQRDKTGYEVQLSANHLGHFLLTNLLLPKVKAAGPNARVVNVTSLGHKITPFRFDDWNFSDGATYDGWTAYGQSKTANILFTTELARRGVTSLAAHPGTIYGTGLARHMDFQSGGDPFALLYEVALRNTGKEFVLDPQKTLSQGAAPLLAAALDPDLAERSGAYIADCQVEEAFGYSQDQENAKKLWALSEELVGQKFPE